MNMPDEYLQEKIDSYTKAHKGEDPEETLADMRGKGFINDDDLDRAAKLYRKYRENCGYQDPVALNEIEIAFYEGGMWQKAQFEKNRLVACDKQTEEEANIEIDFAINIIEKEHRQPTFDDAIKYGMKLQKEQMMKDAVDAQYRNIMGMVLLAFEPRELGIRLHEKVKVIIVKEE